MAPRAGASCHPIQASGFHGSLREQGLHRAAATVGARSRVMPAKRLGRLLALPSALALGLCVYACCSRCLRRFQLGTRRRPSMRGVACQEKAPCLLKLSDFSSSSASQISKAFQESNGGLGIGTPRREGRGYLGVVLSRLLPVISELQLRRCAPFPGVDDESRDNGRFEEMVLRGKHDSRLLAPLSCG